MLTNETAAADDEPHRCELDAGPALAIDTVRRLACDATLVGIVEGRDGEPLNVGRKTRSIPPALSRALRSRDGGCRFPGCDRTRFTQGHHVHHWTDGGETKLSNLVTLCGFHHRLVHEGGFGVRATDDGVFVFTRPDGQRIADCGARPAGLAASVNDSEECFRGNISLRPPTGDAALAEFEETLRFVIERMNPGSSIDADTSRCQWRGEPMDYSMAIEGMQAMDNRAT